MIVNHRITFSVSGGIEAVVAAMTPHKSSAGVQEHACGALHSLAADNDPATNSEAAHIRYDTQLFDCLTPVVLLVRQCHLP